MCSTYVMSCWLLVSLDSVGTIRPAIVVEGRHPYRSDLDRESDEPSREPLHEGRSLLILLVA